MISCLQFYFGFHQQYYDFFLFFKKSTWLRHLAVCNASISLEFQKTKFVLIKFRNIEIFSQKWVFGLWKFEVILCEPKNEIFEPILGLGFARVFKKIVFFRFSGKILVGFFRPHFRILRVRSPFRRCSNF